MENWFKSFEFKKFHFGYPPLLLMIKLLLPPFCVKFVKFVWSTMQANILIQVKHLAAEPNEMNFHFNGFARVCPKTS